MTEAVKNVVVMLTTGKSDNGKNATLAFSCGLSALAMGHQATVFLTSDGAVWGYAHSSEGITVQGFLPLSELVRQFLDDGGSIVLCSVCQRTCGPGGPHEHPSMETLADVELGGFATILELASQGIIVSF